SAHPGYGAFHISEQRILAAFHRRGRTKDSSKVPSRHRARAARALYPFVSGPSPCWLAYKCFRLRIRRGYMAEAKWPHPNEAGPIASPGVPKPATHARRSTMTRTHISNKTRIGLIAATLAG